MRLIMISCAKIRKNRGLQMYTKAVSNSPASATRVNNVSNEDTKGGAVDKKEASKEENIVTTSFEYTGDYLEVFSSASQERMQVWLGHYSKLRPFEVLFGEGADSKEVPLDDPNIKKIISERYQKMARVCHPDKRKYEAELCDQCMALISNAKCRLHKGYDSFEVTIRELSISQLFRQAFWPEKKS